MSLTLQAGTRQSNSSLGSCTVVRPPRSAVQQSQTDDLEGFGKKDNKFKRSQHNHADEPDNKLGLTSVLINFRPFDNYLILFKNLLFSESELVKRRTTSFLS